MTRAEIERLLALYSTGRIADADRDALYQAALDDPALFEELFEEDALREALADRAVRDAALAAPHRTASPSPWTGWLRSGWRWPAFAAVAATAVLAVVILRHPSAPRPSERTQTIAQAIPPAPAAESAPATPPPPAPALDQPQPTPAEPSRAKLAGVHPPSAAPAEKPDQAEQKEKLSRADNVFLSAAPPPPAKVVRDSAVAGVAAGPAPPMAQPAPAAPEAQLLTEPQSAQGVRVQAEQVELAARSRQDASAPVQRKTEAAALSFSARGAAPAIAASIATRSPDGTWLPLSEGVSLSPDTPLRLTVQAHLPGAIAFVPAFTPPVKVKAGESRVFDLPRQDPGDHTLRVLLQPERFTRSDAPRLGAGAMGATMGTTTGPAPGGSVAPGRIAAQSLTVELRYRVR